MLLRSKTCLPAPHARACRLNNADLPNLPQILHSVTEQQYRRLLEGVLEHRLAFSWNKAKGGRAFDYTILSLRRKYLNLKSLYVGTYDDVAK